MDKKGRVRKNRLIEHILNDFSGEEQEIVLKSRHGEDETDYIERLEKVLKRKSVKRLERYIVKIKTER